MRCKEKSCIGEVDLNNTIFLQTGCGGCGGSRAPAYACNQCGRLHWADGSPVYNRGGQKAFWKNGSLCLKNKSKKNRQQKIATA